MYGRQGRESHEKSMSSYEQFARSDAIAIAYLLNEEVGAPRARKFYELLDKDSIIKFEHEKHDILAEFIQKPEGHRPAYLRRCTKGMDEKDTKSTKIVLLVLAIIGCMRVKEVLYLRDNYSYVLAPGSGNRITTARVYKFADEVKNLIQYDWPWEVFYDAGIDDDDDDNDNDDDNSYLTKEVDRVTERAEFNSALNWNEIQILRGLLFKELDNNPGIHSKQILNSALEKLGEEMVKKKPNQV